MAEISKDKIEKAIEIIGRQEGRLITQLNSCVHCGLCGESCLFYLSNMDNRFIPGRKVDLVSSVYKRYCTFTGKVFPALVGARDLDGQLADEMVDLLFGACTMCGRCTMHCSIGVDVAYVVRTGRQMLSAMDFVPDSLQATVIAALETGNNMGIPDEDFISTIQWLEEELQDEVNDPNARIPLNEPGKKVMYTLNPREPKFFPLSISAMAKVFYAAGESWTLSTHMYDVTNYAFFSGNKDEARIIAKRMSDEVEALGADRLVLAECGHGSRAFRWEAPNYLGERLNFDVLTSVELLAEYIRSGRIKVDKSLNTKRVTLHDPCNLSRNGGVIQEQRYILNQCVSDFVEMTPHGVDNYCCGGGGGQLAMSEYNDRRMKAGAIKAEQIRKTNAKITATPCHNCVDQLMQINAANRLNVQIKTLAEIVADALILE